MSSPQFEFSRIIHPPLSTSPTLPFGRMHSPLLCWRCRRGRAQGLFGTRRGIVTNYHVIRGASDLSYKTYLGIKFAPDQSVKQLGVSGVLVLNAPPGGPAVKAGLRPTKRDEYGRLILGDIITSVNGKKIANGSGLYRILDHCKVGDKVIVEVLRGNHIEKFPVFLEPKPDETVPYFSPCSI